MAGSPGPYKPNAGGFVHRADLKHAQNQQWHMLLGVYFSHAQMEARLGPRVPPVLMTPLKVAPTSRFKVAAPDLKEEERSKKLKIKDRGHCHSVLLPDPIYRTSSSASWERSGKGLGATANTE